MGKTINPQPNLREPWLELEHVRELETISSLLDAHPKLNELVLQDLKSVTPSAGSNVGRGGMSAEQVLRALLVKQLNQFSYRELAFHLADSRSYRTFCQLGIIEPTPSKSTLAANIKAVKFETLEQINRELVSVAEDAGIEKGRKVRVDCTVVESNIHPPTDSELLYDCVRVLTRLMCGARELLGMCSSKTETTFSSAGTRSSSITRRWVWLMSFLVRTRKCAKSAAILSVLARFTGSVKPDSSNCSATR